MSLCPRGPGTRPTTGLALIKKACLVGLAVVAMLVSTTGVVWATTPESSAGRYYPETGFRITNASFLDFFDHRGGLRTFGYPVSREFTLQGSRVQFFQRAIMQLRPDNSVTTLNFLDAGLMPYTQINQSIFPSTDPALQAQAPAPDSPEYDSAIMAYIRNTVPDSWQSLAVHFYATFLNTVTASDAFPDGPGNLSLLPGFNLELWGAPTSVPAVDPGNSNFVYQRFQRGIMHYDKTTNTTQGLLLADYVKAVIIGSDLPPDLDAQARTSPLYRQYDPGQPSWLARPNDLPHTDLTMAFEREPIVAIDAGHGGAEIGAAFRFQDGLVLKEKDLTVQVANQITAILRAAGYQVVQTRTTDSAVNVERQDLNADGKVDLEDELQARVDIANNAQATLLLSIHFNGITNPATRGTEVYYCKARPFTSLSQRFASLLEQQIISELTAIHDDVLSRGVKDDGRAVGINNHFYLLGPDAARPSTMPGSLVEGLFLTNPAEAAKLREPGVIEAISRACAKAVMAYYEQN